MSRNDLASERKQQIIKATIECIGCYGYNNFSMQDVARVADVSKGIIHYYFLNKEDLMMAVLDCVSGEIENLLTCAAIGPNVKTQLSNVIEMCCSIVQNKKEYYRINMDFWTQIGQKENVRQEVAKHYTKFRSVFAAIISQGINQAEFRCGDPHQFASLIIALIDGIALQWLFDENAFVYNEMKKHCETAILTFLSV